LKSIASEKQPWVIFVTAYDQYAVRAFEEHALDCLPKPFDAALERAGLQLSKPEWGDVSCAMAPVFVPAREIDRIEAQGNYSVLHRWRTNPFVTGV